MGIVRVDTGVLRDDEVAYIGGAVVTSKGSPDPGLIGKVPTIDFRAVTVLNGRLRCTRITFDATMPTEGDVCRITIY